MVQLTTEKRVFVVTQFTLIPNVTAVQNAFRIRFPDLNPPVRNTILKNVRKYQITGTNLNRNKSNSGRRRTARNEASIAAARELLEETPKGVSAHRNAVAVSKSSFNRIPKLDIRWHPYRMHVRHELLPDDLPRRLRNSNWSNERFRNQNFLQSIIIGDEAGFALNGEVNSHNVREYAPKGNPPAFNFERTTSRAKLTPWAALCGQHNVEWPPRLPDLTPCDFFCGGISTIKCLQLLPRKSMCYARG